MAFDFPASPTDGQIYTLGGVTYVWNGYAWMGSNSGSGGGAIGGVTVSDTPPASPLPGQLWLESDSGALFARWDDGSGSPSVQWVQVNTTLDPSTLVKKAGDTMSGNLTIAGSPAAVLRLRGASGTYPRLEFTSGGSDIARWVLQQDGVVEGGANAGSNLRIVGYDDAGAVLSVPLLINRATGVVTAKGLPAAPQTAAGVGQWFTMSFVSGATAVLPAGGTWAYVIYLVNASGGWISSMVTGIAAGGAAVGTGSAGFVWMGFAWRIA